MDPKSGKPLPLFVNPFALWTEFALKSGQAMLASAQASVARGRTPKVAVIPDAEAPPPKLNAAPRAKASRKAKGKKQRAKR